MNQILDGSFLALVKYKSGDKRVFGYNYGMVLSSLSEDANANGGYTSIALSTPENVIGEMRLTFAGSDYDTLRAAAIVTES